MNFWVFFSFLFYGSPTHTLPFYLQENKVATTPSNDLVIPFRFSFLEIRRLSCELLRMIYLREPHQIGNELWVTLDENDPSPWERFLEGMDAKYKILKKKSK